MTDESPKSITPLVDCHTHLDQFNRQEIPDILRRAQAANVGLIIAAGTTLVSSRHVIDLCESQPMLYAGVGLHPMDLPGPVDDATLVALRELARHPRVVVWSETGLDYLPTSPERGIQHDAFRAQIRLARGMGLPLVVHSREADDDTLRLLTEEGAGGVGGAWHYFQGSLALAQAVVEQGFYISMAKPLLRLPELQRVAAQLPLESIVLETDTYPQTFKKHRHRWTEPSHVAQVAAKLAELHGTTMELVAQVTTANALLMLGGRVPRDRLPLPVISQPE